MKEKKKKKKDESREKMRSEGETPASLPTLLCINSLISGKEILQMVQGDYH